MIDLTHHLEVTIDLAIQASHEIMDVYSSEFAVEHKDDKSPLTEADRRANAVIVKGLRKAFPNIAILSEEEMDDRTRLSNPWCFIVDPLDGTKEFVKRNGEFTVNIALSYHGESVLGVIVVPATGELYYAVRGQGAHYQPNPNDKPQTIHVTDKLTDLTLAVSRSHITEREQAIIDSDRVTNVIHSGSSLKGCLVARGLADIYYRFGPTMEWDTAAMQIICEEAGAIFMQMDHTPMRYNREDSFNGKGFFVVNRGENLFS